jgi:hypothetical protein
MNPLEEKLREALRRKEAPPGFAARVMARLPPAGASRNRRRESVWRWFHFPAVRWSAVAAAVACLLLAAAVVQHRREERARAEGEMAKVEVLRALRIASVKLNSACAKVQKAERNNPENRL